MGSRSLHEEARDALALVAIVCLSAIPAVMRLGFYSDDWGLLAAYEFHGPGDTFAMYRGRPLQALYSTLLFQLFGLRPLGYHLVNMAVIAAAAALLYGLLVRLKLGRAEAFAVSLVFVLLPQLSTVRVWIAAMQVPLSMVFAFLSLHAQLTFDRTGKPAAGLLALAAAILSVAAYEIFAPLIAAFALTHSGAHRHDARAVALIAAVGFLIVLAVLYKLLVSGRAGAIADPDRYVRGAVRLFNPAYDWRTDSSLNLFAVAEVHFWLTLKGWASAIAALFSGKLSLAAGAGGAAILLLSYWRMRAAPAGPHPPLRLLLLGLAVFALGHMIFVLVPSILFSPTGMANRVLVAAALGVALVFVAAIRRLLNPRAFAVAVAFLAFCAALRIAQLQAYWAEAAAIQDRILAAAKSDLRGVPAGSTIILDGVCPYHGPGVVFETYWDVGGAFSLALQRQLNGDAVSPRMAVTPSGLRTSIYKEPAVYPYGASLYAYNPNLHLVVPLASEAAAQSYFRRTDRWPTRCPRGYVGHGVVI